MSKKCTEKVQYKKFCQAVQHADRYMDHMALVLDPLHSYWCKKHQAYHVGHNSRMNSDKCQKYCYFSRRRARISLKNAQLGSKGYSTEHLGLNGVEQ